MTPILGFLLVLTAAFLGSVLVFPRINHKNPIVSGLAVSGIPYILIGVLLGPRVFGFLNEKILFSLEPLISLSLGWAGMLFGIHLRWRNIKRFPANYTLFSAVQGLIAFVIIGGICLVAYSNLWNEAPRHILEVSLVFAALGCNTTPITIARAVVMHKASGRLTHLMQFVSGLDGFWGIFFAGITFALFNPLVSNWITSNWQWLLLNVLLGILIGLAFVFLVRSKFERDELTLLVIGLVVFASGVGFYLRLSPIFLNMIVGIVIAQFRREAEKTVRVLGYAETPIYLFLLLFAGALWNINFFSEVAFIGVFIGARFLGKYLGGWISAKTIDCSFPIPGDVGSMLLSFGGISLAIALNYQLFYGGTPGNLVISAAIIGIIVFDEFAAWLIPRVLKRHGEII